MFESGLDTEQAFVHHWVMYRTYVRRRRTVAIVAAALIAVLMSPLAATAVRPGAAPVQPATRTVVVQQGDTLWAIALRARPGVDPRETVALIQASNGVDAGTLQPGQTLVVPAA
jgi:nucleoid-associated protein YgaU